MSDRPNVVVITLHDTGRHLGCYGVDTVNSPCLDKLASQGVKLTNYLSTVPICCASRASMMTGRYPQSHGLMDLCFPPFNWRMGDDEPHLCRTLHAAGYHTLLFGLQHEVHNARDLPYDEVPADRGITGRVTCDVVADDLCGFLREKAAHNDKPFFAQVGMFETHSPFDWGGVEPDDSKGVFVPPYIVPTESVKGQLAQFQGMIRKVDAAIGRIVDALDASGVADNTILVITTDHGIEFPRAKWFVYDPGLEIFCIWRWPSGKLQANRDCDALLSNVDFAPTMLELVGVDIPSNMQGHSFATLLDGSSTKPTREEIYALYEKSQSRAVRTERYKLVRNYTVSRTWHHPVDIDQPAKYGVLPPVQLFDLQDDPLEFKNLADSADHAAVRAELSEKLFTWMEHVDDPVLRGPLRTPFFDQAAADYETWRAARH